jgi:hypothetical protein
MNILIVPCERKMRDDSRNPREYPYWDELKELLTNKGLGVDTLSTSDIPLGYLQTFLAKYDLILTIDSFIQHFCWYHSIKCAVVWGPSDYRIFGHKEHINITKQEYTPRSDQFNVWEGFKYDETLFPSPQDVMSILINSKSQR